MDDLPEEVRRIFDAKEQRRKELAALSLPEKVKILVQLQRMTAPILRARGIERACVWDIDE